MNFDIVIIGAGVVGTAIARDLSRLQLKVGIFEANPDFGAESSKGNSAIMSAGYDTPHGSLERKLVKRGYERYLTEGVALGLPFRQVGALTLAWSDEQCASLTEHFKEVCAEAQDAYQMLSSEELYRRWPNFGPGIKLALWAPHEGIGDPFSTPYAYLLDAISNGVQYRHSWHVAHAERAADGTWILTNDTGEQTRTSFVINSGGLGADLVEALAGYRDFTVRPRRGQYLVLDKAARQLHDVIALPAPTPTSRGILITPTIFGNVIVGPTAEEVEDRNDRSTTPEGLAKLKEAMLQMVPALSSVPVNTIFAGMRPATDKPEYQIVPRFKDRWLTVAGIRSTGFSGALGIAEYVTSLLVPGVFEPRLRDSSVAVTVPNLSETQRPWEDNSRIATDPSYGEILCHCERISVGEVRDCLTSTLPPQTLKGLKRRTRAMFGRCQGFYCGARLQSLLNEYGHHDQR